MFERFVYTFVRADGRRCMIIFTPVGMFFIKLF
jgi:hypothetical protein